MVGSLVSNSFLSGQDWALGSAAAVVLIGLVAKVLVSSWLLFLLVRLLLGVVRPLDLSAQFRRATGLVSAPRWPTIDMWGIALRTFGILLVVFMWAPILTVAIDSFNDGRTLPVWAGFSTRWYAAIPANEGLVDAIVVSLKIALLSTMVAVVIGTLAGVALARAVRPVRWGLARLLLIVFITPEIVTAIGLLLLYISAGPVLSDGTVRLVIGHSVISIAIVAFVVQARLSSMDPRLSDAAGNLGASPWRAFRQVTLPLAMPEPAQRAQGGRGRGGRDRHAAHSPCRRRTRLAAGAQGAGEVLRRRPGRAGVIAPMTPSTRPVRTAPSRVPRAPTTRVPAVTDRRAQLLDATIVVIAGHCVRGLRVQEVAAEAWVSVPLLYHYFGSREGLLEAALFAVSEDADRYSTGLARGAASAHDELVGRIVGELQDDDEVRTNSSAWGKPRWNSVFEQSEWNSVHKLTAEWVDEIAELVARVVAEEGSRVHVAPRPAAPRCPRRGPVRLVADWSGPTRGSPEAARRRHRARGAPTDELGRTSGRVGLLLGRAMDPATAGGDRVDVQGHDLAPRVEAGQGLDGPPVGSRVTERGRDHRTVADVVVHVAGQERIAGLPGGPRLSELHQVVGQPVEGPQRPELVVR